jgi:glycosyltransferase involved in cell wall biosynthesis
MGGVFGTVARMRLLVVSARYPTRDRPGAGAFVRDRLAGVAATVIAPDRYDRPGWARYASLTWRALTVRGRFDGVEGHFVLPSGVVALLAATLRRLPLIVVAHGSDVGEIAGRSRLHRWLAGRVLRGAQAVVANSPQTAEQVAVAGVTAVLIAPGIDRDRFPVRPRPPERRVLYVGGTSPAKGHDVAVRLANTLVGPGIREVPPSEIPDLLATHDVLLMPSIREGFGLAAAEAIAAGRWVVASAVGGLTEVVEDGVNGTLVAPGGDFAAAIASVPDYDPATVSATATRFDAAHQRDAMASLWERVLAQRSGRRAARGGKPGEPTS